MSSSLYTKNERILVIESDSSLGKQIKKDLEKSGYGVTLVKDGADGLKSIYDNLPHLVLLNVSLVGGDSYEILEKKQAEPMLTKIPVILMSNELSPINLSRIPNGSIREIFMALHARPGELVQKIDGIFGNAGI